MVGALLGAKDSSSTPRCGDSVTSSTSTIQPQAANAPHGDRARCCSAVPPLTTLAKSRPFKARADSAMAAMEKPIRMTLMT